MPENVEAFLKTYHPLRFVNGSFQGYTQGYWPVLDDRADVRNAIAKFYGKEAKPKNINDTFSLLADFKAEHDSEKSAGQNLICLCNGTLDAEKNMLLDHNPDHRLTTKTDIVWNPDAACPRWLQFLEEIFALDIDKTEKINFVQEWFGYCLVPDNSQHKFVWMVGGGGNGKSVLLNILTKLVGETNVSHALIERLDEKFVRAELEGKLVNISAEMSAEATISDGHLKAIVSGDIIEAEKKFKPSFSFRPTVRLVGATNHLPRLLDTSDGFSRRAIILGFNRQFAGKDCDPGLENKLVEELPGVLVWAVEGLSKLRERGCFVVPQSSNAALTEYRTENDPVKQFADYCLTKSEDSVITPRSLYDDFVIWSSSCGYSKRNIVSFGKRLSELGFEKNRRGGKDFWRVYFNSNGNSRYGGLITVHEEQIAAVEEWEKSKVVQISPRSTQYII